MGKLITIDPVTRIEGHLRIDVEVDGGAIKNAWSSGTMWRGIETILQGRDPRDAWAFTQRICGVCTTVHAIASVRSVENALGLEIPLNAQLIRNIIISAHALHDHVVHFYQLSALDWVDVTKVLEASPEKAAAFADSLGLEWAGNSRHALAAVKEKVKEFVAAGQLGIFTNGYWGHPAMKLSPEVNLLAVAHYLQALDVQRKANQVVAILGSKTPNIQNLAVGGVANAINLDSPSTLNMEKLYQVKTLLDEVSGFITQVYLPDVAAIAASYPDWLKYGAGVTNYLAVPDMPLDHRTHALAGILLDLCQDRPTCGRQAVGDHHFLEQPPQHLLQAQRDLLRVEANRLDELRQERRGALDGTGHELRKETNEGGKTQKISFAVNFPKIEINRVTEGLECEEGDPHREQVLKTERHQRRRISQL